MKSENWIEVVAKQVGSLRFGVVQIVVHDSRVVRLSALEKCGWTSGRSWSWWMARERS